MIERDCRVTVFLNPDALVALFFIFILAAKLVVGYCRAYRIENYLTLLIISKFGILLFPR